MCERCEGISRREVIKGAVGLGLAGILGRILGGCANQGNSELPDVVEDHLIEDVGAVRIDPGKLETRPVVPAQRTEYGEVMPRAAWTRTPLQLSDGTPMDGVTRVTIHHSGDGKPFMGESVAEVARHLQIVLQAHLQRGMIDIGYHFAIDRVGRVWQLRWLQYEGQHVRASRDGTRNNEHNIGIVMLGDFDVQGVTVPQRDRLVEFVNLARGKYGLMTAEGKPRAGTLYMHGELVETDCPGRQLKPLIIDARRRGLI
jgi:N-acetylmuramoyl-L-alanine amidase